MSMFSVEPAQLSGGPGVAVYVHQRLGLGHFKREYSGLLHALTPQTWPCHTVRWRLSCLACRLPVPGRSSVPAATLNGR